MTDIEIHLDTHNLTIQEILQTVEDLNRKIEEKVSESPCCRPISPLIIEICQGNIVITMFDTILWDLDEDDREFDEDAGMWQPLEEFLVQEINSFMEGISKITL